MGLFECREKRNVKYAEGSESLAERTGVCHKVLSYTIGFLRFCSKGF